jgi:hypothetical protein
MNISKNHFSPEPFKADFYLVIRNLILFIILTLTTQYITASGRFEMTQPLKDAFRDINMLKIQSGQQKLAKIRKNDPNNAMVDYVENYIDFYTLFIQEDQQKYNQLLKNCTIRLNRIRAADSNSPYYLYCQAEIILQWATLKIKFGEKISAAADVYEAYNLLKKNRSNSLHLWKTTRA